MMRMKPNARALSVGALGLAVALTGCGYAKRAEVQDELARLRSEMNQGDQALGARVDQVEARTRALETELAAFRDEFRATIQRLENAIAFNVPVHFDFDEAALRPQDQAVLDRFAAVVREYYPNALITVEGFTDPVGSTAYNLRLGEARAQSVRNYLVENGGISADRIRTVSYGDAPERLIVNAGGPGEAGLPNRRVALVIDFSGSPTSAPSQPVLEPPAT